MGRKIDFSDEMFSVLTEGEKREHLVDDYRFSLWDILKEIDRRMRRAVRGRSRSVRDYMDAHPDEVERIREKYGL